MNMNLFEQHVSLGLFFAFCLFFQGCAMTCTGQDFLHESKTERDARMGWWREARFGMFIHWGLYSIPAGEWKGSKNHAEWIRTTAQIPLEEYDKLVTQFNPVRFNAEEWVRMAKDAGMKYIVITSKHHDGFCLFDSKYTDFDVMSTPFGRDILKELSDACHRGGITICFYHSIMDWHHPDYLPRRGWEVNRPAEGADFDRYVRYMKNQLKELLRNYGSIGVIWFDGEWESMWNPIRGKDLYTYVRSLQPSVIINNRVGAGRSGMEGFNQEGEFAGDFGTPEQEIPATGFPGVDWETCMTMNDHWGYNSEDLNFKSTEELLHMLADIASKGGNFLLNVGPTAEGVFPPASVQRLQEMGRWMKVNGDAVYGTTASPFNRLEWGRCTQKTIGGDTRLYLHVFRWPGDGLLVVPGILNPAKRAYLLAGAKENTLNVKRREDALVITLPTAAPDPYNSVIVLDLVGRADVSNPPVISADVDIFVSYLDFSVGSDREYVDIRYTLDGSTPSVTSPQATGTVRLRSTTVVTARCFRGDQAVSGISQKTFTKVRPHPAEKVGDLTGGVSYAYYEGVWDSLADFGTLTPVKRGTLPNFDLSPQNRPEFFGIEYTAHMKVPEEGTYTFFTDSDDGSRMYLDGELVVDNDGLHGSVERKGVIALAAGMHSIRVVFFQKSGGAVLNVSFKGPGIEKQRIPDGALFTTR